MTTLFVLLCICAVAFTICSIVETWIYWRQYKAMLVIAENLDEIRHQVYYTQCEIENLRGKHD